MRFKMVTEKDLELNSIYNHWVKQLHIEQFPLKEKKKKKPGWVMTTYQAN